MAVQERPGGLIFALEAFRRAVEQLGDPAIRGTFVKSVVLTAILLLAAWIGAGAALDHLQFFTSSAWLDWAARALAFLATVGLTLLLFSTIVLTVAGLLLDDVLEAVERRWYPGLPPIRRQSLVEILWTGLGFALKAVALNLVALPLYLIPGANIAVFLLVNGWLIGREYFQMVGVRHETPRGARERLDTSRFTAFATGVLIAAMSYIPLLNLVAPIVGAAAMSHVYHRARLASQAQHR